MKQIPAFGNWENCDGLPITQYFETAMQAGLVRTGFLGPGNEQVAAPVAKPVYRRKEKRQRKEGRISGVDAATRAEERPKAVDEDLYKIPPELLYQKPKRKRFVRNLLSGCMGLNCIA